MAANKQLVLGTTYIPSNRSLLEVRFGWSNTQGGKNPPALGTTDNFGITGLPTTFIIGKDGKVVEKRLGPAHWDQPAYVDRIRALAES